MSVTAEASPMIELDAQEFGLHLKQGGWRLGLLVARDVEPGEGNGINRRDRDGSGKVSAQWFAERAKTSADRVLRYYRAWERYADKGHVPHAADLSPGDEPDLAWDRLPHWVLVAPPETGGATGPLNMTIKLGYYGDRLLRAHQRLITFVEKDLTKKPDQRTRELAGHYAESLEAQARILRSIESAHTDHDEEALDLDRYFSTA